jgi:heat shock protein HslJ/membrane-bound inhibitor of C-type lysozyme
MSSFVKAGLLASAAALSGCAALKGDTAPAAPIAFSTEYRCGGEPVAIGVVDEKMTMRAAGEDFALVEAVTASGAKYEAEGDETTWFWSKGDGGTASVRGDVLSDCVKTSGEAEADTMEKTALKARGNEPGWTLDIDGDKITLVSGYGETRVETAAAMTKDGAAKIWRDDKKGLTVVWEDKLCADDATGMPHPARVTVTHGGKTLNGCGGDPKSLLIGAEWIVEDINGGGVIDNSRASLSFGEDGRVSGSSSCNRYSAEYALTGEGLTVSRAAATMMACAPALMDQEQKFFEVLNAVSTFEIDETGALILKSSAGGTILARR